MVHIPLTPGQVTLADLYSLWAKASDYRISEAARPRVEAAAERVRAAAAGSVAVYGVNTGFGKLASVKIAPEDTEQLQRNLSRCRAPSLTS
jgi:histidine ammonia-lyase